MFTLAALTSLSHAQEIERVVEAARRKAKHPSGALATSGGNQSEAARKLGISRVGLSE